MKYEIYNWLLDIVVQKDQRTTKQTAIEMFWIVNSSFLDQST